MRIFTRPCMRNSVLIVLLSAAFFAFPGIASAQAVKANEGASFAGTWNLTVTYQGGVPQTVAPPPGTQVQIVLIFSSDGKLSGPPIPVGLPDDDPVGTWSAGQGNLFSYQFSIHEYYDQQHTQLKDTVYVYQEGNLSSDGNTWISVGGGIARDPSGAIIEADITSSVATRA